MLILPWAILLFFIHSHCRNYRPISFTFIHDVQFLQPAFGLKNKEILSLTSGFIDLRVQLFPLFARNGQIFVKII